MESTQRRLRYLSLSATEVDAFLAAERLCRVATITTSGPHVAPLHFVWDGSSLWLWSLVRSQRWTDLQRDPRVSVIVDADDERGIKGVEMRGRVSIVGDVPRTDAPDPVLTAVEQAYARRYQGRDDLQRDGRHAWLRLVPEALLSWDFNKMADRPTPAST